MAYLWHVALLREKPKKFTYGTVQREASKCTGEASHREASKAHLQHVALLREKLQKLTCGMWHCSERSFKMHRGGFSISSRHLHITNSSAC